MDFFEAQDRARKNTRRLILYYLLAVAAIVAAVYLCAAFLFLYTGAAVTPAPGLWDIELFVLVAGGTLLLIGAGALFRIVSLRRGGGAVAEMLGARKLNPGTRDPAEARLLNVVEEMALASGTPVPDVYVMEEKGINAFAAGHEAADAVVGVTRGCLETLNRDELQGVIAHEFSHILNGDMRLNLRLIGILNGILLLHIAGSMMIRSFFFARPRGGGRKGGGGAAVLAIMALGFAVMIIGFIGVIFARMIQSAVSRQREFLADSAAVQFTRNPDGIAGALKKILNSRNGTRLENSHAIEAGHLFFGQCTRPAFTGLFATHPPLEARIRALDPSFNAKEEKKSPPDKKRREVSPEKKPGAPSARTGVFAPAAIIASVGNLRAEKLDAARKILSEIPRELTEAAHDLLGAEAIVHGLLLDKDPCLREKEIALVGDRNKNPLQAEVKRLSPALARLPAEHRLPLLDLALPALHGLSTEQYDRFRNTMDRIIRSDRQLGFFEFILTKVVSGHLDRHFRKADAPAPRFGSFAGLENEAALLLSALAYCGEKDSAQAYANAVKRLPGVAVGPAPIPPDRCHPKALNQAVDRLASAVPGVKRQFLDAAVYCVCYNGRIETDEGELLRALADALGCPLPPLSVEA